LTTYFSRSGLRAGCRQPAAGGSPDRGRRRPRPRAARGQGPHRRGRGSRAGLTVGSYTRIERGESNPTWITVTRIVDALGASLRELGEAVDKQRRL